MFFPVPERLAGYCRRTPERAGWLQRLPRTVEALCREWSLTIGAPFDDANASWVAPVTLADGSFAVLKLGMPHMEAEHEIHGLRFWNGDGCVRLLRWDDSLGAMLLEGCEPGTSLRVLPEAEQDVVIAGLLRRLWRKPPAGVFRPLAALVEHWSAETLAASARWPDPGLVREGLRVFEEFDRSGASDVLLATDLHAGNVLRARREPWLMIDPKPFVGDAAYDATQHLINCESRLFADPLKTVRRMADLLEIDYDRLRLWIFARAAADPRDDWGKREWFALAKSIA